MCDRSPQPTARRTPHLPAARSAVARAIRGFWLLTATLALTIARPTAAGLPAEPWAALGALPRNLAAGYVLDRPAELVATPAGDAVLTLLAETQMLGRMTSAWQGLAGSLGMTPRDAVGVVFGERAAVLIAEQQPDQNAQPWAIIAEISADSERRLTAALKPVPRDVRFGVQVRAIEFGRYRLATLRGNTPKDAPGPGHYTAVIVPEHAAKLLDDTLGLLTGGGPEARLAGEPGFAVTNALPEAPIVAFYRTAGLLPGGSARRTVAFAATPDGPTWTVTARTLAAGPIPLPDLSLAPALNDRPTSPVLAAASCSRAPADGISLADWLPPSETISALRALFAGLVPSGIASAIHEASSESLMLIEPPADDRSTRPSVTLAARLHPTATPAEQGDALTAELTAAILDRPTELGLRTKQFARRYPSAPRRLRLVRGSSVAADQLLGPAPMLNWVTKPASTIQTDQPESEPIWVLTAAPVPEGENAPDHQPASTPSATANKLLGTAAVVHGLRGQGTLDPSGLLRTLLPPVITDLAPIRALARIESINWRITADRENATPAIQGTLTIRTAQGH